MRILNADGGLRVPQVAPLAPPPGWELEGPAGWPGRRR